MHFHSLELGGDFSLIGIHTPEEDYRLAFLLNQNLHTKFTKFKHDLDFKNNNSSFSIFEFDDVPHQLTSYLISNKCIDAVTETDEINLFTNNISYSSTSYLISEKKTVDYFLKIDGEISQIELNNTIDKINNIKQIKTSYKINPSKLKSKDFLIF